MLHGRNTTWNRKPRACRRQTAALRMENPAPKKKNPGLEPGRVSGENAGPSAVEAVAGRLGVGREPFPIRQDAGHLAQGLGSGPGHPDQAGALLEVVDPQG